MYCICLLIIVLKSTITIVGGALDKSLVHMILYYHESCVKHETRYVRVTLQKNILIVAMPVYKRVYVHVTCSYVLAIMVFMLDTINLVFSFKF